MAGLLQGAIDMFRNAGERTRQSNYQQQNLEQRKIEFDADQYWKAIGMQKETEIQIYDYKKDAKEWDYNTKKDALPLLLDSYRTPDPVVDRNIRSWKCLPVLKWNGRVSFWG